jgi:hypothetical protein
LVSAFTIMVIAIDRWRSVTNPNPSDTLSYSRVVVVITAIWAIAFSGKKTRRRLDVINTITFKVTDTQ